MARRGSMDHNGFASRARRGARAENVAYGVKTKQQAIALWWGSSGHAANMRLAGCKAVASAVGHDGQALLGNGDINLFQQHLATAISNGKSSTTSCPSSVMM
ncbi:MAG: hypothetical protein WBQ54_06690, partial [Pseudolabrys sp.]